MARKRVNNRSQNKIKDSKGRFSNKNGIGKDRKSFEVNGKNNKKRNSAKLTGNKSLRDSKRRALDNKSYGDDIEIKSSKYLDSFKTKNTEHRSKGKNFSKSLKDTQNRQGKNDEDDKNLLIGRNPINEALRAGQAIDKVWVLKKDERGRDKRLSALVYELKQNDAVILELDRKSLDRLSNNQAHQGIIAQCPATEYKPLEDLLAQEKDKNDSFLILLDRLQDPHNLGAVLRVADTANASGIIIPKHESVGLTNTVAKSSAGAISYVPVTRVQNLGTLCDRLKDEGYWLLAADMDGENIYTSQTLDKLVQGKVVLMIGNEGKGLADKLRTRADLILSIPTKGNISSLNASVSTAIIAYEILRRREYGEQK